MAWMTYEKDLATLKFAMKLPAYFDRWFDTVLYSMIERCR